MKNVRILTSALVIISILLSCSFFDVSASAKIKLNKKSIILVQNETFKLKLKGAKGKVSWKSSNKSAVSVSANGKVKAKKKGYSIITAKYKKIKYKCKIKVETPYLNKTSLSLKANSSYTLKIKGSSRKAKWSTSNKKIATVTNGKVVGINFGNATITATIGEKVLKCSIQVINHITNEPDSNNSLENNTVPNNTEPTNSVKEKYEVLKEFLINSGAKNDNGNYGIYYTYESNGISYTYSIFYLTTEECFEFTHSSEKNSDDYSKCLTSMRIYPNNDTDSLQVIFILAYNNSNYGCAASTELNKNTYEINKMNKFDIQSSYGVTDSYIQELADIELDLALYSWSDMLSYYLKIDFTDFGFQSIYN